MFLYHAMGDDDVAVMVSDLVSRQKKVEKKERKRVETGIEGFGLKAVREPDGKGQPESRGADQKTSVEALSLSISDVACMFVHFGTNHQE